MTDARYTLEDLRLAIANANEIAALLGLPPVAAMPADAPPPPPVYAPGVDPFTRPTPAPNRVRWWVGDGDRWWRIGEE